MSTYDDMMDLLHGSGSAPSSAVDATTRYQMDSKVTYEVAQVLQDLRGTTLSELNRRQIEEVKARLDFYKETAELIADLEETAHKDARTSVDAMAQVRSAQVAAESRYANARNSANFSILAEGRAQASEGLGGAITGLTAVFNSLGEAEKTPQFSDTQMPEIMRAISRESAFGGYYSWDTGVSRELIAEAPTLAARMQREHERAKNAQDQWTDYQTNLKLVEGQYEDTVSSIKSMAQGDPAAPELVSHAANLLKQMQAVRDEQFGYDPSTLQAEYDKFLQDDELEQKLQAKLDSLLSDESPVKDDYNYSVAKALQHPGFRDFAIDRGYDIGTSTAPAVYIPSRADKRAVAAYARERRTGRVRGGRTGELVTVTYDADPKDATRYKLTNDAYGKYAYIQDEDHRSYKTQAEIDQLYSGARTQPTLKLFVDETDGDSAIAQYSGETITQIWHAVDGKWVEKTGAEFNEVAKDIKDRDDPGWLTNISAADLPLEFVTAKDIKNSERVEDDVEAWKSVDQSTVTDVQQNWGGGAASALQYTDEPPHGQVKLLGRRRLTSGKDQAEHGAGAVTVRTADGVIVIPESRQATVVINSREGRNVIGPVGWIRRQANLNAGYKAGQADAASRGEPFGPTKWSRGLTNYEDHSAGFDSARSQLESRYGALMRGALGKQKQQDQEERLALELASQSAAPPPAVEPVEPVEVAAPTVPAGPTTWKDEAGNEYRYTPETGTYEYSQQGGEWQAVTKPDAIKAVQGVFKGDAKPWDAPPPTAAAPEAAAPTAPVEDVELPAGTVEWTVKGGTDAKGKTGADVAFRHDKFGGVDQFYYKSAGSKDWKRVPDDQFDLAKGTWNLDEHGEVKPWDKAVGPDELTKIEEPKEMHPLVKRFLETPAGTRKERRADRKAMGKYTKGKSAAGQEALAKTQSDLAAAARAPLDEQIDKEWQLPPGMSEDVSLAASTSRAADLDEAWQAYRDREAAGRREDIRGDEGYAARDVELREMVSKLKSGEAKEEEEVVPMPSGSPSSGTGAENSIVPGVRGQTAKEAETVEKLEELRRRAAEQEAGLGLGTKPEEADLGV